MTGRRHTIIDEVWRELESSEVEGKPLSNYFAAIRRVVALRASAFSFVGILEAPALTSLVLMVTDRVVQAMLLALQQKGGEHWIISDDITTTLSTELPTSVFELEFSLACWPALTALISAQLENGLRSIERFIRAAKFLREAGVLGSRDRISKIDGPLSD